MLPIDQIRAETPGCAHVNHLNNAGSSLPPASVLKVMTEYLEFESRIGGYEAFDARATEIAGFYTAAGRLLNTTADNIAYTGSATDSYARALSAIPWVPGDIILTTENDYVSNQIAFLALQKHRGVKLVRARDLASGGVDVADMEQLIRKLRPRLVAVTHVPTNSGLIQPVAAIGAICRAEGVLYLVDACQSAGQLVLDVQQIGCDFLTATMRKFMRGPRGAGFLYASDRVLDAGLEMMLPDMRSAYWSSADQYETERSARRFEYWEMPYALVLGSKVAIEYALHLGMHRIEERVRMLADYTRQLLHNIDGVRVLDLGEQRCGIVTAWSPHWTDKQALLRQLAERNIHCRVSPEFVARIDFPKKGVEWVLRISPHYYNTESEIAACCAELDQIGR